MLTNLISQARAASTLRATCLPPSRSRARLALRVPSATQQDSKPLLNRSFHSVFNRGALRIPTSRSHPKSGLSSPMASIAIMPNRKRPVDNSSLSNPGEIRVVSTHFVLDVHFDTKTISGTAKVTAKVESESPKTLDLDTNTLTIKGCKDATSGKAAEFSLAEPFHALGSKLSIDLPAGLAVGDEVVYEIDFSTSPTSSACQFLSPAQTAGGKHPYLFTQCQAIHARSLVPCQDTPGAKMSYTAEVWVPEGLTALMSAVPEGAPGGPAAKKAKGGKRAFTFRQDVPIPPYLLALAVGELESRKIGPRSRVWSEPSMVEAGEYEFGGTNEYLEAGEAIAGEYTWGVYDLLLLPPSFPYGGMENPCLTFVTPTLLAGDRSLANVVAHEIAHSWTGNLVTNSTWEHFWLNEGFTVFLERKILGRLQGEAVLQQHALMGLKALEDAVRNFGEGHKFTQLVPDLSNGADPDDAFSRVPYEKGFNFLYYLQSLVGVKEFEEFLKIYIKSFQYKTLTSLEFKDFFLEHFKGAARVGEVDWDTWFFKPGMPPVENQFDGSLTEASHKLAMKWHTADVFGKGGDSNFANRHKDDIRGWTSTQVVAFLERLQQLRALTPLHADALASMDKLYQLSESRNSEIRHAWYLLGIPAKYEPIYPKVREFLSEQGRMKFLRPLYRALKRAGGDGEKLALDTFKDARDSYHPIAQKVCATDLGL